MSDAAPDIAVRCATLEDFDRVLPLYAALVGSDRLAPRDMAREQWETLLSHPGSHVFCAGFAGETNGMATLHILPNLTWHGRSYALIENVVTCPKARGRGVGRAVMEAAIDAAWAANCYKIMLLTGRKAKADGFYARLGFAMDEKWGMTLRRTPIRQDPS